MSVLIDAWTKNFDIFGWVVLAGLLISWSCALVGNFLILRRMSLMGDAISHSLLPGLVVAFVLTGHQGSLAMFIGALVAGVATSVIVEFIQTRSIVKQDSAIAISFTTLFALGIVLVNIYTDSTHLDADCVLFGELAYVPLDSLVRVPGLGAELPATMVRLFGVFVLSIVGVCLFYKELVLTSFDAKLARSMGFSVAAVQYGLMILLSFVIVASFEAVGAILVVAMLILPGCTARLVVHRIPHLIALSFVHATLSTVVGLSLGMAFDLSLAASMVVTGSIIFALVAIARSFWRSNAVETPEIEGQGSLGALESL